MEWISVKDQLPDKEVLCVNERGYYLIGYVSKDGFGFFAENEHEILPKVKAWMPLPEPPKE